MGQWVDEPKETTRVLKGNVWCVPYDAIVPPELGFGDEGQGERHSLSTHSALFTTTTLLVAGWCKTK